MMPGHIPRAVMLDIEQTVDLVEGVMELRRSSTGELVGRISPVDVAEADNPDRLFYETICAYLNMDPDTGEQKGTDV